MRRRKIHKEREEQNEKFNYYHRNDFILGALIVNTLILGDENSLKTAAEDIMDEGTSAIMDTIDFRKAVGGA